MTKLRILLLAQQMNPDWISVPLVGYHQAAALSRLHDVTLVTHSDNRDAILRREDPFRAVACIDSGGWENFYNWAFVKLFRGDHGSQILTAFRIPFYWAFEYQAWKLYKNDLKRGGFDVVLRITPVAPVIPSLMARFCKKASVPFVIGPINGGLPWPPGYSQAERQKEWVSNLRFLYRYLPFARSTYRDARAIIAGSSETYHEYRGFADKVFFMPENGISEEMVGERAPRDPQAVVKLIFVGRLIPSKACDLAIRAVSDLLRRGAATFTIVGDGVERGALEGLARELGIEVTITGMLPHAQAMEYFRTADILVFPSIREFGGGVIFEALAVGCVPIVSNYGGPGDIVIDGKNGFKVDLKGEAHTTEGFKKAIESLCADPALLERMMREGQRFAREELSWKGKARQMTRILNWVLGGEARPDYRPPRQI